MVAIARALKFQWSLYLGFSTSVLLGIILGFVVASPEGSYIIWKDGEIVRFSLFLYAVGVSAFMGLIALARLERRQLKAEIKKEILEELAAKDP